PLGLHVPVDGLHADEIDDALEAVLGPDWNLDRLRVNPLSIQNPIGAADGLEGVVDLIRMKAIYWDMETQGMKFEYRDIPASLRDEALKHRTKMIEVAAEANDTLMHKYLEGEQLSDQEIRAGLRERSIRNEIVLCMCGTAFKNKGVQALLD